MRDGYFSHVPFSYSSEYLTILPGKVYAPMGKKEAQAEMQFEKKQFVLVKSSQDTNYVSLQFSSLEWTAASERK